MMGQAPIKGCQCPIMFQNGSLVSYAAQSGSFFLFIVRIAARFWQMIRSLIFAPAAGAQFPSCPTLDAPVVIAPSLPPLL
jgi:hypothetical protein